MATLYLDILSHKYRYFINQFSINSISINCSIIVLRPFIKDNVKSKLSNIYSACFFNVLFRICF